MGLLDRYLWRRSMDGEGDAISWMYIISGVVVVLIFLGSIAYTERGRRHTLHQARERIDAFCAQSPRRAACEAQRDAHHERCANHFAIDSTSKPRRGAPVTTFKPDEHVACVVVGFEQYFTLKRAKTPARVERDPKGGFERVVWMSRGDELQVLP